MLILKRALKHRPGGHCSADDYDVCDQADRVVGRIMLHPQPPPGRPWLWSITARGRKPSLEDRGYVATLDEAIAAFRAQWHRQWPVSEVLKELACVLADWAAPAPGVTVYVFGSRVRDDHRLDSDIDVCFEWSDGLTDSDAQWSQNNEREDYRMINRKLPGPLAVHPRDDPWYAKAIAAPVVYQDRNVRCVWLPPK